jgi:hypothetical protein
MKTKAPIILALIALLASCITAYAQKDSTNTDSSTITCLTQQEIDVFHRIYNGRQECYDYFLKAVQLARHYKSLRDKLSDNNQMLEKLLKRHQLDDLDYEKALELAANDLSALSKINHDLERKVKRKNSWIYALVSFGLAEAISIAMLAAL